MNAGLDLDDVPMTPTMEALSAVGLTARDLKSALAFFNTLAVDAAEGAWAEGHLIHNVLKVQGRPSTDRASFATRLRARDIDTGESRHHRVRASFAQQHVPEYLRGDDVLRAVQLVRELSETIGRIEAGRKRQYPDYHEHTQAVIDERKSRLPVAS
ncbi:hypothetical protein ACH4S8_37320 [Streptomyces sp. NPDC021080]|uniref:hypothetical protein n=1 Tax=Streptomyces sp. NPDC021080 TaxID=3365110 RepID=UPI00379013BC